jgi:hypothetical protein
MSLLLLFNQPRDPRHLELIALAQQLCKEDKSELAVVAAQTACEVYAEVAIRRMLQERELGEFDEVIPELLTGYSLMDRRGQRVFHALTGESIQRSAFWSGYKTHVELRNRVVHRGEQVTSDQAADSIRTAKPSTSTSQPPGKPQQAAASEADIPEFRSAQRLDNLIGTRPQGYQHNSGVYCLVPLRGFEPRFPD